MPSIKNIIIFLGIGLALVLVYSFFIKNEEEGSNLSSNTVAPGVGGDAVAQQNASVGQDFLTVLLNIKNIKLDDSIFSNPAFKSLRETVLVLEQDGTEGRPNPFAPIGVDALPATTLPDTTTPPPTGTPPPANASGATETN